MMGQQDEWAAERRWRPSKAPACPRVVVGKRCLQLHLSGRCVCVRYRALLDHGRCWLAGRRHIVTGEPYHVDVDQLAAFAEELRALGVDIDISGNSPWNPGQTVRITLRAIG